jgi:PAS domain S-box-containing protein
MSQGDESRPGNVNETPPDVLDELPVGYLVVNAEGLITKANRAVAGIFERRVADIVGHTLSSFYPDTPLARVQALSSGKHWPSGDRITGDELEVRLPDGRLRWVRLTVAPIVDDRVGRLVATRILVEDISEELLAGASRRRASVRFRIAFANAAMGMHLSTAAGRFLEVNAALCRMLGYSEDQLLDMHVWDIAHPDDVAGLAPARAALFAGEPNPVQADSRFVRADGSVRWCRLTAILPNGPEGYLVSQVTDISDLVEHQQSLANMMKDKDRFVAAVSRELRAPLTGVLGFASELRDGLGALSPEEIAEFASLIVQGCVTVNNSIEDLLVAARLEAGDLPQESEPTDLHQLAIAWSADAASMSWPEGKEITVEGEPCVAWADPNRVNQIIRNLVGNAARYGGNHTTLITGTTDEPRQAFLRVIDDGPGMTGGLIDRLFHGIHQGTGDPGRSESIGVGLYLSRRLAQLMSGDLTYRRQYGTTIFELDLPLCEAADPDA